MTALVAQRRAEVATLIIIGDIETARQIMEHQATEAAKKQQTETGK